MRSLQATKSIPLGFNAEKVFTAHIYLTDKQQRDATRTQPFFQSLTGGNFRLFERLLTQIERIAEINNLARVNKEAVEAARESLVIGQA